MSRMMQDLPAGGGGQAVAQGAVQQNNIADEVRNVMRQVRELTGQIDAIAQSFPVASQSFDSAKAALIEGVKAIIANSAGPEPPATRTF